MRNDLPREPEAGGAAAAGFPRSIDGVPCLLPGGTRRCAARSISGSKAAQVRPALVAEFDDSALMYAFGEEGKGIRRRNSGLPPVHPVH